MSPTELLIILAMVGYAIYKQTRVSAVEGSGRFKLAIIYGAIGVAVGGFAMPQGWAAAALIAFSVLLSLGVGLLRGRLTRVWMTEDGRIFRQGTAVTVGLFVAMIAVKFGIGAFAAINHVNEGGGLGEVMVMVAVMVAVQAEIVWQRAQQLRRSTQRVRLSV